MIVAASKALKMQTPIGNLTMSMIRVSGKPPKLKLKAAESRYMLVVLHFILHNFMPPETPHEVLVLECVDALAGCYETMKPERWSLDPFRSSLNLQRMIQRYLVLLQPYHRQ